MSHSNNQRRHVIAALILGAAALVTNALGSVFYPDSLIIAGNVFLYWSAIGLGVPGAIISAAIGAMPEALAIGDPVYGIRMVVVTAFVGYFAKRSPRIPAYIITLALWTTFIGPALYFSNYQGMAPSMTGLYSLVLSALGEVFLSMIAGALLLRPALWTLTTNSPRHLPIDGLLTHVLGLVAALVIFASLALSHPIANGGLPRAETLLVLAILGVSLPAMVGHRLSSLITSNFHHIFAGNLMPGSKTGSFTLLSNESARSGTNVNLKDTSTSIRPSGSSSAEGILPQNRQESFVSAAAGVIALNRNGTISFINRKFKSFAEITQNDIIGKTIDSVPMTSEVKTAVLSLLDETFTRGPRTVELRVNQLPSRLRFFELASQRSTGYEESSISNGPDSVIITLKEITERRTIEAHLLQAQKLHSLGEAVTAIAHAFNNSLTTISGYASFAKHLKATPDVAQSLDQIMDSATSAGELVRKLIDYAESKPAYMRPLNLVTEISSELDLLKKMSGEHFEIEFKNLGESFPVLCDTNLLIQALSNIIANAKESYGSKPGNVWIELAEEQFDDSVTFLHLGAKPGKYARVKIKDEGVGMSRETLARAFDPLFTTKASSGHSGLGLSIVYAIMRAHDGFLSAESKPDKGTTISLYFPIADEKSLTAPAEQSRPSTQANDVTKNPGANVLVVEDEPTVRELVVKMLQMLGYQVKSCADGVEAFGLSSGEKFDLILIDMVMPKMNGLELANKIKGRDQSAKVLIMSGYGVDGARTETGLRVLPKPFDLETLAGAVRSALTPEASPKSKGTTISGVI